MGRAKRDHMSLRNPWINDLKVPHIMKIDGSKIICLKGELEQHIQTTKHKRQEQRYTSNPQRQILLSAAVAEQPNRVFNEDLCRAFISAGIPWNKLTNPELSQFLEKYTGKNIPDESTLRKNYLPKVHATAVEQIRREIGMNPIWLSIDEATDANGHFVANVIVGKLTKESTTSHLFCSRQLDKTNNSTVTKTVLDALQLLWPGFKQEEIQNKFLLFVTDGAKYMLKTGKNLKNLYNKLLHITCIVHGVNRVAEEIRSHFPELDKLIANMKATFKKAPSRTAVYKAMYPDLPLPPDPVITRWGTWLSAAEFYANHFNEIKNIVEELNNDSKAVETLKTLMKSPTIAKDLAFISVNYTFISNKLIELQERNSSLNLSLKHLDDIENKVFSVRGEIGKSVIAKWKDVIGKNPWKERIGKT